MRMLRPSPGEVADRQTILNLKAKYGEERQMNVAPFVDENEMLQRHLENNWFPDLPPESGEAYDKLLNELAELNLQVWKLTDQAHVLRDAPDRLQAAANARAAEVLFAITDLNDKRADIVGRINRLFGVDVQEKIFA